VIPDLPWLLWAGAFLLGGFVKGALGVGLPLVAVPLLSLGMPPQTAIAWLVVPVLASNAWQAVEGGAVRPTLRRFGGLLVAQAIATIATVQWTLSLDAGQLSAMVAFAVLLAVLLMVWQPRLNIPARREHAVGAGVGLLSGMLGGVSSLMGPIIITYLMALHLGRDAFVRSVSVIYLLGALPLYGAMVAVGHIGWRELALSASGLVPMAAGLLAGKALRQRLDDRWFRRVLLAFLVMLAVLLLLK
jgi:uncharacterized membrane protein YfcA